MVGVYTMKYEKHAWPNVRGLGACLSGYLKLSAVEVVFELVKE